MTLIDFSSAPSEPIQRLVWLGGIQQALRSEIDAEWARTYFDARLKGMMEQAIDLKLHSRKRALAWTRHVNEERGRAISRWPDGL